MIEVIREEEREGGTIFKDCNNRMIVIKQTFEKGVNGIKFWVFFFYIFKGAMQRNEIEAELKVKRVRDRYTILSISINAGHNPRRTRHKRDK